MSNLKAGDIMLFKGESGISKIIMWLSLSPYSHIALCVSGEIHLIIEATNGCVRASDTRKLENYDVYRVKEDYGYNLEKVISYLVSELGSGYDYLGVAYLGLLKLLGLKGKANRLQIERDMFCSELVTKAFKEGGLNIVPTITHASITSPGDIANSEIVEKI